MTGPAVVSAMVHAEDAWLRVLVAAGAPLVYQPLTNLVTVDDLPAIASDAESGGNPVIPLVAMLRDRLRAEGNDDAARWVHRGLTSQDVMDTAMMQCAGDAVHRVRAALTEQVRLLSALATEHRTAPMPARTLTKPAVPTTFGAKVATWLHGVLDSAETVSALRFPVQLGGAAGTLSGLVELVGEQRARACRAAWPDELGLDAAAPWHTRRAPVTRLGDAAVSATDAWGHIANDVLVLGRSEIGEAAEATGGGSSTMPHKSNPTMSVLIRRAALAGPPLAATLHCSAAAQVDERADGAWHAEWDTLAVLLRRTVIAGSQTGTLLAGLRVNAVQMAVRLAEFDGEMRAEQKGLASLAGHDPASSYFGLVDDLIDEALTRAAVYVKESP